MNNDNAMFSKKMRLDILEMCYRLGKNESHLGGCMSLVEILTVLFNDFLRFNLNDSTDPNRDRIIMSKGQGSIALYAAMYEIGLICDKSIIRNLIGDDAVYYKQSVRNTFLGIDFSSGSLGQGLAYGIGIGLALKRKKIESRIVVIQGDGECDEGSVWEAASIAGHYKMNNLYLIVDCNGLQIDGMTRNINSMEHITNRFESMGFSVIEIDGHNYDAIKDALNTRHDNCPLAIIAKTIKGKGISFAENNAEWHQNILTEHLYKQAITEIM